MGEEGKSGKDQIEKLALRCFPFNRGFVPHLCTSLCHALPLFLTSAIKVICDLINAPKYTGLNLLAPAPVDSAEGTSKDVTTAESSPAT